MQCGVQSARDWRIVDTEEENDRKHGSAANHTGRRPQRQLGGFGELDLVLFDIVHEIAGEYAEQERCGAHVRLDVDADKEVVCGNVGYLTIDEEIVINKYQQNMKNRKFLRDLLSIWQ